MSWHDKRDDMLGVPDVVGMLNPKRGKQIRAGDWKPAERVGDYMKQVHHNLVTQRNRTAAGKPAPESTFGPKGGAFHMSKTGHKVYTKK